MLLLFLFLQRQAEGFQLGNYLVKRFLSKVPYLNHIVLGLVGQVFNRVDPRPFEAVEGTDGEVELLNGHFEDLALVGSLIVLPDVVLVLVLLGQVDEQAQMVAHDLCAETHRGFLR